MAIDIAINFPMFGSLYDGVKMRLFVEELERLRAALRDVAVLSGVPQTFSNDVSFSKDLTIIGGGTLFMSEVAGAGADIAGFGQLWVKNTAPCQLWFTNDVGTDTQIV